MTEKPHVISHIASSSSIWCIYVKPNGGVPQATSTTYSGIVQDVVNEASASTTTTICCVCVCLLKIFTQNCTSNQDLLTSYCTLSLSAIPTLSILVQSKRILHINPLHAQRMQIAHTTHIYIYIHKHSHKTKRTYTKLHARRIRNSLCYAMNHAFCTRYLYDDSFTQSTVGAQANHTIHSYMHNDDYYTLILYKTYDDYLFGYVVGWMDG